MVRAVGSSIGRKFLTGLSGLALIGFLVGHLGGNLNLYRGTDAMNAYAEDLHHLPGFVLLDYGVLALVLGHIALVAGLILRNKAARSGRYAVSASKRADGKAQSLASRTMVVSGAVILGFVILHLLDMRFQRGSYTAADGSSSVGEHVVTLMQAEWRVAIYVVGSLLVAWHGFHGLQSAFRSVGLNHRKYTPLIEKLSAGLAVVLGLGFASIPVATYLGVAGAADDVAPVESSSGAEESSSTTSGTQDIPTGS
jgi:succinate dehydrogenase / fumarate reductase, cytochrome b subunit